MQDEDDRPRWWTVAWQLPASYAVGSLALGWPLSLTLWPGDLPDLRTSLITAASLGLVLTVAVFARSIPLALGAAVLIPILVSAGLHALEVRWNTELQGLAASGDPGAIAAVLRGRQAGWLGAIGPFTVMGSVAALAYAGFCLWKLERET